jgi:hypothetical protein
MAKCDLAARKDGLVGLYLVAAAIVIVFIYVASYS